MTPVVPTALRAPAKESRRLDIQGLRAIAVLAVIAFHAGLPLPGGFVGVDVFFVISGFVITSMLHREWAAHGRISFPTFWKRRFLRLTPALALVVATTFLLSVFILFPDQQRIAFLTGTGAMLLVANIVIARTTGGYFDDPAASNPLLNTWSLSVEEQFYLIFPLVLACGWAVARRSRLLRPLATFLVLAIAVISFALTIFSHTETASSLGITWLNFYSPAIRAWEFAAGALLALATRRLDWRSSALATTSGAAGVLMLAASFVWISGTTEFPGPWTLLPVMGTLALIAAGSLAPNPVSAAIAVRPLTAVGDWSYSLYLWHWPLIVFATYLGLAGGMQLGMVALVSAVPALASYYFVERPIRNLRPVSQRSFAALVATVMLLPLILGLALSTFIKPTTLYAGDTGSTYLAYIDDNSYPCMLAQAPGNLSRCRQSQPDGPIQVAVVGDSHAEHLYPGLIDTYPSTNIAYVYLPDWPYKQDPNAQVTISAITQDPNIDSVIIGARWTTDESEMSALRETLKALTTGNKRVFITDDSPYFSFHARECKYQRPGGFLPSRCQESSDSFEANYSAYSRALRDVISEFDNVSLLSTSDGFCGQGMCRMTDGSSLLFADRGHLNVLGSRKVITGLDSSDGSFHEAMTR